MFCLQYEGRRSNSSRQYLYLSLQAVGAKVGLLLGSCVGGTVGVSELKLMALVGTNVGNGVGTEVSLQRHRS